MTEKKQRKGQTELQVNSAKFNNQLRMLAGSSSQLQNLAKVYGLEKELQQIRNLDTMLYSRISMARLKTNNDIRVKLEMKRMQAPTVLPNAPKAQPLVQNVTEIDVMNDWDEAIKEDELIESLKQKFVNPTDMVFLRKGGKEDV